MSGRLDWAVAGTPRPPTRSPSRTVDSSFLTMMVAPQDGVLPYLPPVWPPALQCVENPTRSRRPRSVDLGHGLGELGGIQPRVRAVRRDQCVVCALLDDGAVLH